MSAVSLTSESSTSESEDMEPVTTPRVRPLPEIEAATAAAVASQNAAAAAIPGINSNTKGVTLNHIGQCNCIL